MSVPDRFIERRTVEVALRDGTKVRLRPITPDDKDALVSGFRRMSPESRYRRFMGAVDHLTAEQLRYLTEIDYVDHYAVVAFALDTPGRPGIGVARYVRSSDDPTVAEAAVAVVDDHQGRGVGTLLLTALGAVALENGITRFRAFFINDNAPVKQLLDDLGATFTVVDGEPVAEVDLPARAEELKGTPLYGLFRAVARGEVGGWRQALRSLLGLNGASHD